MISKLATAAALAVPLVQAMPHATLMTREEKIVGGEPAELGEFPFLVGLTLDGSLLCGGSLVNANTVITAAHCSDFAPSEVAVAAGTINISEPGQELAVESIIVHPEYTDAFNGFDIAVWKLSTPVEEGPNVGFVSLPEAGSDLEAGAEVTTAGWGRLSGGGELPEVQQKVTLPVITREECSSALGGITETMVCAGTETTGACNGDSGGPLIDAAGALVGTVSWGSGQCLGTPTVFGHVGALLDFVNANL